MMVECQVCLRRCFQRCGPCWREFKRMPILVAQALHEKPRKAAPRECFGAAVEPDLFSNWHRRADFCGRTYSPPGDHHLL